MLPERGFAPGIPQRRVMETLDRLMAQRDYEAAERHLAYWRAEAQQLGDTRGLITVLEEAVGFYRKTAGWRQVRKVSDELLLVLRQSGLSDSLTGAAALVNIATAYAASGDQMQALELFEQAESVYRNSAHASPDILGGFYNNMGLTLTALGRYEQARESFGKAIAEVRKTASGAPQEAICRLNLADALEAQRGYEAEEEITGLLEHAYLLLEEAGEQYSDGEFAFICEKCAPVFDHYGYFREAQTLKTREEKIRKAYGKGT